MEKNSDALTTALNKLKEDLYNNIDKKYEEIKEKDISHNYSEYGVPAPPETETIKPQRDWYDLFDPLDPEVEEEKVSKTR